jgi:hypothetical protein
MSEIYESELIQGDTGPLWHISVPSITVEGLSSGLEVLTNYTCTLVYTNSSGVQVTRAVINTNTANTAFLAQMTSAETDVMNVGKNKIVLQVKDNAGVPYRSEVQIDLTVRAQRYTAA